MDLSLCKATTRETMETWRLKSYLKKQEEVLVTNIPSTKSRAMTATDQSRSSGDSPSFTCSTRNLNRGILVFSFLQCHLRSPKASWKKISSLRECIFCRHFYWLSAVTPFYARLLRSKCSLDHMPKQLKMRSRLYLIRKQKISWSSTRITLRSRTTTLARAQLQNMAQKLTSSKKSSNSSW